MLSVSVNEQCILLTSFLTFCVVKSRWEKVVYRSISTRNEAKVKVENPIRRRQSLCPLRFSNQLLSYHPTMLVAFAANVSNRNKVTNHIAKQGNTARLWKQGQNLNWRRVAHVLVANRRLRQDCYWRNIVRRTAIRLWCRRPAWWVQCTVSLTLKKNKKILL